MRKIPLTQGYVAVVDSKDHARVSVFKWTAMRSRKTTYAYRKEKGKSILLHRFILDASAEERVDHKDRDGLNCRRSNLRVATASQNGANKIPAPSVYTPYKGAHYSRRDRSWATVVQIGGKRIHGGTFKTDEAAARAYDALSVAAFGQFALTNFPRNEITPSSMRLARNRLKAKGATP